MEGIMIFFGFIAGLLVRLGIPILFTVLVAWWLRKLDERWERESELERARALVSGSKVPNRGCWKINGCPPDRRQSCPAYAQPKIPCWQVFRSRDGLLSEKCIGCKVFREAPVPV